jgi:hypothetical protein
VRVRLIVVAALLILGLLAVGGWGLAGCNPDWHPCERDLDCMILCECGGAAGTVTVGPYPCRAGTCGQRHFDDMDCERPCSNVWILGDDDTSVWTDDDDSAGDDDSADDDDSGDR